MSVGDLVHSPSAQLTSDMHHLRLSPEVDSRGDPGHRVVGQGWSCHGGGMRHAISMVLHHAMADLIHTTVTASILTHHGVARHHAYPAEYGSLSWYAWWVSCGLGRVPPELPQDTTSVHARRSMLLMSL